MLKLLAKNDCLKMTLDLQHSANESEIATGVSVTLVI